MPTLIIDGMRVQTPEGASVLEACRQAAKGAHALPLGGHTTHRSLPPLRGGDRGSPHAGGLVHPTRDRRHGGTHQHAARAARAAGRAAAHTVRTLRRLLCLCPQRRL